MISIARGSDHALRGEAEAMATQFVRYMPDVEDDDPDFDTQALLRLARQRISVLFAMLRDGTFYQSRTPTVTLAA